MTNVIDTFWKAVAEIKANSGPYEPIRNPYHPINSAYHPLRSAYHPLRSPYHPLNNPYNANRGKQQLQALQQLISQYLP